jgi:cystathionine beta-lyase/cystathionine gamma-synthase
MKVKYFLYILIPFLLSFSCEQKEDKLISDTEDQITGEWIWIKSTYYNTNSGLPFVLSPDSVGYSVRQVFAPDGTYLRFKNDLIESSGIFWLETITNPETPEPDIRLFSQKGEYIQFCRISLSGDSLLMDNTAADGTLKLFRRFDNQE